MKTSRLRVFFSSRLSAGRTFSSPEPLGFTHHSRPQSHSVSRTITSRFADHVTKRNEGSGNENAGRKERELYKRHAQKATGSILSRIKACAVKPESHDSWDKNSIIPESLPATKPLTKEPEDSGYEIGHG